MIQRYAQLCDETLIKAVILIDMLLQNSVEKASKKMIKSFAHKGLETFFLTGSVKGIQVKHSQKLKLVLTALDAAATPSDMNFPGSNLHQLHGNMKNLWSVKISGNWRITFRFEAGDAYLVDYQDYH